jgi:hypothetical protein
MSNDSAARRLTVNQRAALECFQRAQSRGVALSAQAREQSLNVRVVYDAVAALRRKGALPPGRGSRPAGAGDFLAVRVAPQADAPMLGAAVCRLRIGSALIECSQWPPAAWLASLTGTDADAAPGRD